jgi:hypothetical protein
MKLDVEKINADIERTKDVDDSNCLAGRPLQEVKRNPLVDRAWRVTMEWMRGHHIIVNQIGTIDVDSEKTLTLQNWAVSGVTSNWFEELTGRWVKERDRE